MEYRIYRRRRRWAGFVTFCVLAVLVIGVVAAFGRNLPQDSGEVAVDRVAAPILVEAPEAASTGGATEAREERRAEERAEEREAREKERAEREQAEKERKEKERAERERAEKEKAEEERRRAEEEANAPLAPEPADNTLYLTVPKLGLYDNVVSNSSAPTALDYGAAKLEESGFPWQRGSNTYISAHRLGYPGTASHYQFYNLPLLGYGDVIYVSDANGTTYTYQVTEILEVTPQDLWVTEPAQDGNMISLQTCTEYFGDYWTMGPTWSTRYVVRGQQIGVDIA